MDLESDGSLTQLLMEALLSLMEATTQQHYSGVADSLINYGISESRHLIYVFSQLV